MKETPNQLRIRNAAQVAIARYLMDKGLLGGKNIDEALMEFASSEAGHFDKYIQEAEKRFESRLETQDIPTGVCKNIADQITDQIENYFG